MNKIEYLKKINEKYIVDKYTIFEANDEIKCNDTIKVQCCGCGSIKSVNARTFIRITAKTTKFAAKLECKICRNKRKEALKIRPSYTTEIIQNEFINKYKINNYINNTHIECVCLLCNNTFTTSLISLRRFKNCCHHCNATAKYSLDDVKAKSKELYGDDIIVKNLFFKELPSGKKHYVTVEYKNREYSKPISEFFKFGIRLESSRNIESLKSKVESASNGDYTIKDKIFLGNTAKYNIICKATGEIRFMMISNFLKHPTFKRTSLFSKYTIKLFSILNSLNIYFKTEKTFKNTGKKRFDIFIPSSNLLIEIDGEQHFKNIRNSLLRSVNSDIIKNKFCIDTDKTLLRISYQEFSDINKLKNIILLAISKKFNELLLKNYNILLIHNKKIFNEKSYYEPTKMSMISILVENLFNCGKSLRA